MIKFSNLVTAIQNSAEQAAFAVSQENLKTLLTYFNTVSENAPSQDENSSGEGKVLTPGDFEHLIPKSIKLKFPKETPDGPQEHDVYVPLISLSPVTNMHVEEMEIEMDMEILEQDGDIMVGFPYQKKSFLGQSKATVSNTNAKVKIKISPGGKTTGVNTIIEGYDKVLRAQIPS